MSSDSRSRGTLARWSVARVLAACSAVLAGCATDASTNEDVGRSSDAIYGGTRDVDTLEANVVVQVDNCTGTLVSPLIVLTAAHCIWGTESPAGPEPKCSANPSPAIYIGANKAGLRPSRQTADKAVRVDACVDASERGIDLALLYLNRPVLDEARIERPSLGALANGNAGMTGFSPYGPDGTTPDPNNVAYRQVKYFSVSDLSEGTGYPDNPAGQYWYRRARRGSSLSITTVESSSRRATNRTGRITRPTRSTTALITPTTLGSHV